jgi:hypothetical protein
MMTKAFFQAWEKAFVVKAVIDHDEPSLHLFY